MTKARLLLAGSILPFLTLGYAGPLAADPGFVVAQQVAPEDAAKKGKQAPKKDQPPASKQPGQPPAAKQPGQSQPPAAKGPPGQPPAPKSAQPPAQATPPAPKSAQPPAQATPPAPKSAEPPAQTTPPAPKSAQPPAKTTPPAAKSAQPPAKTTPPAAKSAQPPAQTTPPAGQPGQPPAARRQPPGQPPATETQTAPPAAQQPTQTQPPAARRPPPAGAPPAAQGQTPPPAAGQSAPPAAGQTPPPAARLPRPGGAIAVQPTGLRGQPLRRVEDLRQERREERQGDRTVIREGDRTLIRMGDRTIIRHNETDRFRHAGRELAVERRGGEVRTVIERPDGTRIITVTDENGRLLRRSRRTREGREIVIIDNRVVGRPGARADFYVQLPPPVIRIPRERYIVEAERASREDIYETLVAPPVDRIERRYSLDEVRYSPTLRERMPRIDIDTITFESGSWEITPDQVDALAVIAEGIKRALARNPNEVFMIEGHTDATGTDDDNLSLSDRRAESVALALSEQFEVPAENLTTQGYGEQNLKVPTEGPERQNRRVTIVRITPLLTGQAGGPQAN